MLHSTPEFLFGAVNTISIAQDSLILVPALIGIGLLIACSQYLFQEIATKNYLEPPTPEKLKNSSALQERPEPSQASRISLFRKPQIIGLGSLAFLAVGGSSFLVLQPNENLPLGVTTSEIEKRSPGKSSRSSFIRQQDINQTSSTPNIIKIDYISSSLSTIQKAKQQHHALMKPFIMRQFHF